MRAALFLLVLAVILLFLVFRELRHSGSQPRIIEIKRPKKGDDKEEDED